MTILKGKGVFGGIAFGKISIYNREEFEIKRYRVEDTDSEIRRYESAKKIAIVQLQSLYEKALQEVGETNAMIFQIHQMMLEDLDYCESIINIIKNQNVNAEYAVGTTSDNFSEMFSSMDDSYMKERAADVRDVSKRLLKILADSLENVVSFNEPSIIAADDLAPSETVQLDKNKVLGFVTMRGSSSSHTAILARTMNIPAIIGVGSQLKDEFDGCEAIIDGYAGDVYINPDHDTIQKMREKQEAKERQAALLLELKGRENITLDGKHIEIFANIGNSSDVGAVLQNDAGGIGLFRSEFLYLENDDYPSEDQQFAVYKDVAEKMSGKKVIIRTLDIGADKQVDYFKMPHEENPAMGYRAIRMCLDRLDIFKTQLRALYRASAFGKIAIMFPMIISVDEVKKIKEIIKVVKKELEEDEIQFSNDVELGIMIETPAAAIISDDLAKEVDFFSIGTNDLSQYTLAIDRQNDKLTSIFDSHHKAILRLIKFVADNAHKNGIWVGICGELGADESLTETFLSMGIDELSVSPPYVLGIRKKVIETDVSKVKEKILEAIK